MLFYSPLRFPGGKNRILGSIKNIIRLNSFENKIFIEPYAGGASIALGLLLEKNVPEIYINDINFGISAFWKSIVCTPKKFIQKIKESEITIKEWEKQRFIYKNQKMFSLFDVAFATFYLNRCNRGGILTAGVIGGVPQNGKYLLSERFNKQRLITQISRIYDFKDKIHVSNLDAIEFIEQNKDKFKNGFIYLDPPYYKVGHQLYEHYYKHEGHEKLSKFLKTLSIPWILSYDDTLEIKKLYKGHEYLLVDFSYSIGKKRKEKELLFSSRGIR